MTPHSGDFISYMEARHGIYKRRVGQHPKPWTTDPVLQAYRFCNVYRELDTVTVWIRENIREPFAQHPNLWFMLCIARQINWPPTLQALMDGGAWPVKDKWDWKKARGIMQGLKASGEKVYTGAYMLNAHGILPDEPKDKAYFTCKYVLDSVWQNRHLIIPTLHQKSLKLLCEALKPYHGWGMFTAYEVACDLRYTRYLEDSTDAMTWANAGPGAVRGLNRLHGRLLDTRVGSIQCTREMVALLAEVARQWKLDTDTPKLEMREIEHTLCEFDKYERVRLGEGRPRSKYNGRGET